MDGLAHRGSGRRAEQIRLRIGDHPGHVSFGSKVRNFTLWFPNCFQLCFGPSMKNALEARWVCSVVDCWFKSSAHTGSEHGSDHTMFRACLRLRMILPEFSIAQRKAKRHSSIVVLGNIRME